MMTILKYLSVALVMAASTCAAADVQYPSQVGRWNVNKTETQVPPGGIKFPDTPFDITKDDGKSLVIVTYKSTPEGLKPAFEFKGAFDGEFYPAGPGKIVSSYRRLSPTSYFIETRIGNGMVFTETVVLSENATKMRFDGKSVDAAGKVYTFVLVYNKE